MIKCRPLFVSSERCDVSPDVWVRRQQAVLVYVLWMCMCAHVDACFLCVPALHRNCCVMSRRRCRYGGGLGAGDGPPHDVWRCPSHQDLGHWQRDEGPGTHHAPCTSLSLFFFFFFKGSCFKWYFVAIYYYMYYLTFRFLRSVTKDCLVLIG